MSYKVNGIAILPGCNFTAQGKAISYYKHENVLFWQKEQTILTGGSGSITGAFQPYETREHRCCTVDIPDGNFTKVKATFKADLDITATGIHGYHGYMYLQAYVENQWVTVETIFDHSINIVDTNEIHYNIKDSVYDLPSGATKLSFLLKAHRANSNEAAQGSVTLSNVTLVVTG